MILGAGSSIGDIDAYKQRNYMYTLKSVTRNLVYFEVDAKAFNLHIHSIGKDKVFKAWQKRQERLLLNKLAANLFNIYRGINPDSQTM